MLEVVVAGAGFEPATFKVMSLKAHRSSFLNYLLVALKLPT
jgi:hypothetical protein